MTGMKPCACGKDVRLRASKIGRCGVFNYIQHVDGTPVCIPGKWDCIMLKPYPKTNQEYPSRKMIARWEQS